MAESELTNSTIFCLLCYTLQFYDQIIISIFLGMKEKVRLFELTNEYLKVTVDASFENGDLLVDGYDIGRAAEEWWGDSDYEYSVTVKKEDLLALCNALGLNTVSHEAILEKMKEKFSGNHGFTAFSDFLKSKRIKYYSFSWT